MRGCIITLLSLGAFATLSACITHERAQLAVLTNADAATMADLETQMAQAMDVGQVKFGAGDLTQAPMVSVLPSRLTDLETASPALPRQFNLHKKGDDCYLIENQGGLGVLLSDVSCSVLE